MSSSADNNLVTTDVNSTNNNNNGTPRNNMCNLVTTDVNSTNNNATPRSNNNSVTTNNNATPRSNNNSVTTNNNATPRSHNNSVTTNNNATPRSNNNSVTTNNNATPKKKASAQSATASGKQSKRQVARKPSPHRVGSGKARDSKDCCTDPPEVKDEDRLSAEFKGVFESTPPGFHPLLRRMMKAVILTKPPRLRAFLADFLEAELGCKNLLSMQIEAGLQLKLREIVCPEQLPEALAAELAAEEAAERAASGLEGTEAEEFADMAAPSTPADPLSGRPSRASAARTSRPLGSKDVIPEELGVMLEHICPPCPPCRDRGDGKIVDKDEEFVAHYPEPDTPDNTYGPETPAEYPEPDEGELDMTSSYPSKSLRCDHYVEFDGLYADPDLPDDHFVEHPAAYPVEDISCDHFVERAMPYPKRSKPDRPPKEETCPWYECFPFSPRVPGALGSGYSDASIASVDPDFPDDLDKTGAPGEDGCTRWDCRPYTPLPCDDVTSACSDQSYIKPLKYPYTPDNEELESAHSRCERSGSSATSHHSDASSRHHSRSSAQPSRHGEASGHTTRSSAHPSHGGTDASSHTSYSSRQSGDGRQGLSSHFGLDEQLLFGTDSHLKATSGPMSLKSEDTSVNQLLEGMQDWHNEEDDPLQTHTPDSQLLGLHDDDDGGMIHTDIIADLDLQLTYATVDHSNDVE